LSKIKKSGNLLRNANCE